MSSPSTPRAFYARATSTKVILHSQTIITTTTMIVTLARSTHTLHYNMLARYCHHGTCACAKKHARVCVNTALVHVVPRTHVCTCALASHTATPCYHMLVQSSFQHATHYRTRSCEPHANATSCVHAILPSSYHHRTIIVP